MTSDQRIEKGIDFKATHFKLGGSGCRIPLHEVGEFPRSTNDVHYKPFNLQQTQAQASLDANKIRRTNFVLGRQGCNIIGTTGFQSHTTHGDSYQGKGVEKGGTKSDLKTAKDLRNAHFILGHSSGAYLTESQREYVKKEAKLNPGQAEAQKELVGKIRGHHFNLGNTKSTYLTTSSATYAGAQGMGQSKSSPKIGQDLRTAHFDLGKENGGFVTSNQIDYTKKVRLSESTDGRQSAYK